MKIKVRVRLRVKCYGKGQGKGKGKSKGKNKGKNQDKGKGKNKNKEKGKGKVKGNDEGRFGCSKDVNEHLMVMVTILNWSLGSSEIVWWPFPLLPPTSITLPLLNNQSNKRSIA